MLDIYIYDLLNKFFLVNHFNHFYSQRSIQGGDANGRAAFWRVKYIRNVSFSEMERNCALIVVKWELFLLSHESNKTPNAHEKKKKQDQQ